jgi:hypothetical protein
MLYGTPRDVFFSATQNMNISEHSPETLGHCSRVRMFRRNTNHASEVLCTVHLSKLLTVVLSLQI